jgi:hypothetical protein
MMPRNILFLDLDGVLHRAPHAGELTIATSGIGELLEERPDLCQWSRQLADALEGHACGILVHSSWRAYVSSKALRSFLSAPIRQRFLGVTPPELEREQSIIFAVRAMGLSDEEIIVIDDEPEQFRELRHRLVVCDPELGLTTPGVKMEITTWLSSPRARPVRWK